MFKVALMLAFSGETPYQASMPPLGLGYLAAFARRRFPDLEFRFCSDEAELEDFRPDLLAVSSATENYNDAVRLAGFARNALGIPVFLGGMHITSLPGSLAPAFSAGVVGEGEATFAEIVELYRSVPRPEAAELAKIAGLVFRDGGVLRQSAPRPVIADLDSLPWPDRDTLGNRWGTPHSRQIHMITSRGCPYDCAFCSSGAHWHGVRYFSVEYAAREIEAIRKRYDPLEIYFFDDLLVADRKRFIELCRTLMERGLHAGIAFRTFARANLIDEEIADWFERCRFECVDFGFESNSAPVLEYLNKRGVTPETNQRAVDLLKKRNISIGASLIIGSAPETRENALESLDFVDRNRDAIDRLSVGVMCLLPGTRVWREALARGIVSETMDWSLLNFNSLPAERQDLSKLPLMLDGMTRGDLGELYAMFRARMEEINSRGEGRFWHNRFADAAGRARQFEGRLRALEGSRLVRAALALRRLFGAQ